LREAIALATTAALVGRGEHPTEGTLSGVEAWAHIDSLEDATGRGPSSESVAAVMTTQDLLTADQMDTAEALRVRPELERTLQWLLSTVELRSPLAIKVRRGLRVAAVLVVLAGCLIATLTWALSPPNVAAGRPVKASSRWPGSPDPSGLTDGIRGNGYGAHTTVEDEPWVEIDLGASHLLREVVVHHRSDGFQHESLPLTLELSDDQVTWSAVATRSKVFTDRDPWRVKLDGNRARWVRLVVHRRGYIALSEIEIYGSKA